MTVTSAGLIPASKSNAEATAADRKYVFHSWSAQGLISPVPIAGGEGSWFWDADGKRYLDFASQLVNLNLGHQHPRLVQAIRDQAEKLCTVAPSFANDARTEAARLIVSHAPKGLERVFFTNGGAEAIENAIRLVRLHTGRHKILTAYRSYHGATAGALMATGEPRRWGSEPGIPGVVRYFGPYPYRSSFHSTSAEEEKDRVLQHLDELIMFEGPKNIAGILFETVTGTNGVLIPPDGYLAGVRALCDRHGIMMIADEVMVGFGRIGEWFAVDRWQVAPDLLCFAKGVNSGYIPLGGVLMTGAIADTFKDRPYPGGLTYSGHPLACAVAVESIRTFEDEDVVGHARRLGEDVFGPELRKIGDKHPSVGEVRGIGCFWALDLVRNRTTREPLVPFNASGPAAGPMNEVVGACKAAGVWPMAHFNRLQVAPPLIITPDEARQGLAMIDRALDVADKFYTG